MLLNQGRQASSDINLGKQYRVYGSESLNFHMSGGLGSPGNVSDVDQALVSQTILLHGIPCLQYFAPLYLVIKDTRVHKGMILAT